LEKNIVQDYRLSKLFSMRDSVADIPYITDYIRTRYMSGYLSRFEFQAFYYDNEGLPLENYLVDKPAEYRENVVESASNIPFTSDVYRLRSDLGTHEYFTHLPIPHENDAGKFHHDDLSVKNLSAGASLPSPEIVA